MTDTSKQAVDIAVNDLVYMAKAFHRETLLRHAALLRAIQEEREWKPIETAPFNKVVLLWRDEWWVAARVDGAHGPGWCTPDGFEILNPTHWLPLPTPPQDGE